MNITFLGAAEMVTGSCYYVETEKSRFIVDCGMFQGSDNENYLNEEPFPFNPAQLDFVLLTHCHIDHCGRLPKLCKDGFKGLIYATKATADLCEYLLPDSAYIQEMEAEWLNRKGKRSGKPPVEPLYTLQDAADCLKLFKRVSYDEVTEPGEGVKVRFKDAGHILGSAIIELWVREGDNTVKLVFSGDLGNKGKAIIRDPSTIEEADYVIIESTYGDRLHSSGEDSVKKFLNIIDDTVKKGGNIIIPSFALGRTQEIIYELNKHKEKYDEKMKNIYRVPVFIDSPLAISVTEVFRNNPDCYDEEAREYIDSGDNPLDFPGLRFTRTTEESKALNELKGSKIILSASGMCEAGRIKHHLKHNLWKKENTILFMGYQASGTLGRRIADGARSVKIFGESITVNARVEKIDGFSGHADMDGLIEWLSAFRTRPKKVFVVHGDKEVMAKFAGLVESSLGLDAAIPQRGASYSLEAKEAAIVSVGKDTEYRYIRLAVLDQLERLREELDSLSESLVNQLKGDTEDWRVQLIYSRLSKLEKDMGGVLN